MNLVYLARFSINFPTEGLRENVDSEERRQRQPQELGGGGRQRWDVEFLHVELDRNLSVGESRGSAGASAAGGIV